MKLRASHIVVALGVITALVLGLAIYQSQTRTEVAVDPAIAGDPELEFLQEVRKEAVTVPLGKQEVGTIVGEGMDPSMVPVIEVETHVYDMGTVANDKPTKGQVMVFNRGKLPLEISQVTTSCACTMGTIVNKTIPPGGQEPMIVTIDPNRIPGFDSTKTLSIYSNDSKNSIMQVDVTCKVEPEFSIEPRDVDFGVVTKGEVKKAAIKVVQLGNQELVIHEVKPSGAAPGLTMEAKALAPENGKNAYEILVTLDTSALPASPYQANYTMKTSIKRLETFFGHVSANIVAPYHVEPRPVSLGSVIPGQSDIERLKVTSEQPFTITDLAISGKDLSVSERRVEGVNTAFLDISVSPDAGPGVKREEITFKVNVAGGVFAEKIAVSAVVARGGAPAEASSNGPPAAGASAP